MNADHCHDLVRLGDRDRYLASLFAPDHLRPQLLALYAFNVEIARIRETVSDAMLGEIKLKWWHDAIEGLYAGAPTDHPVIEALKPAVNEAELPKQAFINMIAARQFDLYDDAMPSLGALEGYLGETSSMLIRAGATREFLISPDFGCFTPPLFGVSGNVFLFDSRGANVILPVEGRFR